MIDEVEYDEVQEILDFLSEGNKMRHEKIRGIKNRKRKYKGIYRTPAGKNGYWTLDKLGNPEMWYAQRCVLRLTTRGIRLAFPIDVKQSTLLRRLGKVLHQYGWNIETYTPDDVIRITSIADRTAFLTQNKLRWYAENGELWRGFLDTKGIILKDDIMLPYQVAKGKCDYYNWRTSVRCEAKATLFAWGGMRCSDHAAA